MMRTIKRSMRSLILALISALLAVLSTPPAIDVRDWPRRLRRAHGLRLLRRHGYMPIAGGMALPFALPENLKIVEGLAPQVGAAAAVTGDYISLKNAHKAYVVIHYNQGDATSITWHVKRATAVAPTGAVVLTEVMRIWSNLDCATSDTLVERTAAVNYASGTGQTHKQIVFEVDPATLADTFDCIAGCSTTAIAATSTVSIMYYLVPRYASRVASQPTVITD